MHRGRITTISFDADDTLWDFNAAMRRALACALGELRRLIPVPVDALSIDSMIAIRNQVAQDLKMLATRWKTM
ncbi:MAG: hypothetical protein HYY04_10320 [Chloroflexi bacterium]|nr:hypothetical protein [Chloroflexota bacterium]